MKLSRLSPPRNLRVISPPKNKTLAFMEDVSILDSHSDVNLASQYLITNPNPTLTKIDYASALITSFNPIPLAKTKSNMVKLMEKNNKKSTMIAPSHVSDNDLPAQDMETEEEIFVCAMHESKVLLHCANCNIPLCLQCMKRHHQDNKKHDYIELNELKEKISNEALQQIGLLEEKVKNLEPDFNLDDIQQVGLKSINESKEKLLKVIDDFYAELIKSFNSLTYKKPISSQKAQILNKRDDLKESLEKFKKDFHINLISGYFKQKYDDQVNSLLESIKSYQSKISTEFRRLPFIKSNVNVLKDIQELLLNYVGISLVKQSSNSNNKISNLQASSIPQVMNTISVKPYFKTTKKYLHHLFPLERRLFLYDINTNRSIFYPLTGSDDEIPLYPSTIFTPELDLYILGGLHPKTHEYMNSLLKYDKMQGLITLSKLLEKKMAFGLCCIAGLIYIFGGKTKDNERIDLCERYSIKTNKWEPIGKMKEKRSSPGVCSFKEEEIYLFFGTDSKSSSPTEMIEQYNIKTNSWVSIYPVNWLNGFEKSQITCHQINENQILLFGGVNRVEGEGKDEKIYKFCTRMMIFDVIYKNFENWGNALPQGSLNLGQSFIENNNLYALRTLPKSSDNQFESGFAVLRITDMLEPSYINVINCNDIKTMMKLQKQGEKME